MITYRNPLWDTLIQFLKELKDYPAFQESSNGKFKKTIEDVYNRACKNARITDTDWKVLLLSRVLPYLKETDLEAEAFEVFKHIEETNFDKFCFTSKEGYELFDSAKKDLAEIRSKKNKQAEYEKTYREYEAAKEAHEKFLTEQEKTRRELEEKEKRLELIQKELTYEENILQEGSDIINNVIESESEDGIKTESVSDFSINIKQKVNNKKQKTTGANKNEPAGDKENL